MATGRPVSFAHSLSSATRAQSLNFICDVSPHRSMRPTASSSNNPDSSFFDRLAGRTIDRSPLAHHLSTLALLVLSAWIFAKVGYWAIFLFVTFSLFVLGLYIKSPRQRIQHRFPSLRIFQWVEEGLIRVGCAKFIARRGGDLFNGIFHALPIYTLIGATSSHWSTFLAAPLLFCLIWSAAMALGRELPARCKRAKARGECQKPDAGNSPT